MDDGELDFSNHDVFSNSMGEMPIGGSMDSFFEELMKDTHTCTHTHTCNPPGPDFEHAHTCYHVHTKIIASSSEDKGENNDDSAESVEKRGKKRPLGNREAVRKYREKKKARAASLEDEILKLRTINQQLLKRLHGQAALEAEVSRLRCLLVDIRGRIEGEIGSFPYQKPIKNGDMFQNVSSSVLPGSNVTNPCNIQCNDQMYCLTDGKNGDASLNCQGLSGQDFETLNCFVMGTGSEELPGCGPCDVGNLPKPTNSVGSSRRKGSNRAAATDS